MSSRQRNYRTVAATCLLLVGTAAASIRAQTPPPTLVESGQARSAGASAAVESVPLRVDLVLSRSQGTKKISSLPYTLIVSAFPMSTAVQANPSLTPQGQATFLRLGVDVYTGRSVVSSADGGKSAPEYQYVGTNIDCRADYRTAGTYRLYLSVSDTTLVPPSTGLGGTELVASVGAGVRRFSASNTLTVRDGQVTQFTVGTDPLTGETIRIDVTATAIK